MLERCSRSSDLTIRWARPSTWQRSRPPSRRHSPTSLPAAYEGGTAMKSSNVAEREALLRRGRRLQYATIAWNVMEVFVTIGLGVAAGSLALIAFGLDS